MKEWNNNQTFPGKEFYDSIEIPKDLTETVNSAIDFSKERMKMSKQKNKKTVIWKYTAAAAATVLVLFVIGLNTSEAFAKEAGKIPVIGLIAKVLTIRSYEVVDENVTTKVEVPGIVISDETENTGENVTQDAAGEDLSPSNTQAIQDVNAEIKRLVDDYIADANVRIAEYKEAFLSTGGTEEEWLERDISVNVDYVIKAETDKILSLALICDESWAAVYGMQIFYNIDLQTGEYLTLEDVLGKDYAEIANQAILEQMEERVAENDEFVYWGHAGDDTVDTAEYVDMGGFTTVGPETKFYINEAGNPVVVFDKYMIAPGFMGEQEFEIEGN